ncbi:UbiA prenyltransferase family-domain-containing protein [Xylaria venustula]|nr:UbiA prenyltransferase family-domain-containing protein [Xylaria venustula]
MSPHTKKLRLSPTGQLMPAYHPPTSGILSLVPSAWIPYLELARVDRPTGIYHFYFPHLFGTLFAACNNGSFALHDLFITNIVLFGGSIFYRGAACSWNDFLDQDFDRQVSRCCLRPLARRALTPYQGHCVTGVTALLALGCITFLPRECLLISVPSIILSVLYPFAKRFTNFPQALLGLQLAIGFFMGAGAIEEKTGPHYYTESKHKETPSSHYISATAAFYLSNVCWTMVHDVVYAQQDAAEDAKAEIRSMAVHFNRWIKPLLFITTSLQVSLLFASGVWAGFGQGYFLLSCGLTTASLVYMLHAINLDDPSQCAWFFTTGQWFVNLSTAAGLLLQYLSVV